MKKKACISSISFKKIFKSTKSTSMIYGLVWLKVWLTGLSKNAIKKYMICIYLNTESKI